MSAVTEYTRRNQQTQTSQTPEPHGSVTQSSPLAQPIHAEMGEEAVKILALGNVSGFSPSYLVVDEDGMTAWVPLKEIRIVDPNFLPRNFRSR